MSADTLSRSMTRARDPLTVRTPAVPPVTDRALNVLAADPDPAAGDFYRATLHRLGHQVHVVTTGPDLVTACRLLNPDLVLTAAALPDLDGLTAVMEVAKAHPVPVVLVSDGFEPLGVARALAS